MMNNPWKLSQKQMVSFKNKNVLLNQTKRETDQFAILQTRSPLCFKVIFFTANTSTFKKICISSSLEYI